MNTKCKTCGSCGMPLEKPEDFALGRIDQIYCHYCTDEKGKLLSFEKILDMNVTYYIESQGLTREAALKMAGDFLKTLPAWKTA